ncbi:HupE/UreJ family protein [Maricurvus nonylphenolicus]|uniref:HupE/UreJ family protein n=1 Tax=Maricurvus nonylphenolicus TaxID=1008307 RepID=UPI0036F3208A
MPGLYSVKALLCLLGCLLSLQVYGHNASQSFSRWVIEGDKVEVTFTVGSREVTRLPLIESEAPNLDRLLSAHLLRTLQVSAAGQDCHVDSEGEVIAAERGLMRKKITYICPEGDAYFIAVNSFFSVASSHVHYASVDISSGQDQQYLFTSNRRVHDLNTGAGASDNLGSAILQYLELGVFHIIAGIDHLAFLLALILMSRRLSYLVWIVSGFTLGHSITLSLAALGLVTPDIGVVEALIGFSIAVVAIENIAATGSRAKQLSRLFSLLLLGLAGLSYLAGRSEVWLSLIGMALFSLAYLPMASDKDAALASRPLLTLIFGLVHGFGFAGVLSDVGLPDGMHLPALAGFNIGVEIGQLLFVVFCCCLLRCVQLLGVGLREFVLSRFISSILLGLGSYWLVIRSLA